MSAFPSSHYSPATSISSPPLRISKCSLHRSRPTHPCISGRRVQNVVAGVVSERRIGSCEGGVVRGYEVVSGRSMDPWWMVMVCLSTVGGVCVCIDVWRAGVSDGEGKCGRNRGQDVTCGLFCIALVPCSVFTWFCVAVTCTLRISSPEL